MEKQILKLRAEGKSYNEISKIVGCSKSTVCYHCGKGQKEKSSLRQKKKKTNSRHILNRKLKFYLSREVKNKVRDFQRKRNTNGTWLGKGVAENNFKAK